MAGLESAGLTIGNRDIGGQSRIRTLDVSRRGYRVYSPALSASQPTAQTRIVKDLAEGSDLNAYVLRDPGLADQWDTNYPSLPGTNNKTDLQGS